MFLISLFVLLLLGMASKCLGGNDYDIRLESVVALEGEEQTLADYRGLKITGRERVLNGTMHFSADLSDDMTIALYMHTFKNGEWTPSPYGSTGLSPCEFVKKLFFKYFDPENQSTNLPKTTAGYCPLRKGDYWIMNASANTDKWVSFMKRGLLKVRFEILQKGKIVGGFEAIANTVDRTF